MSAAKSHGDIGKDLLIELTCASSPLRELSCVANRNSGKSLKNQCIARNARIFAIQMRISGRAFSSEMRNPLICLLPISPVR